MLLTLSGCVLLKTISFVCVCVYFMQIEHCHMQSTVLGTLGEIISLVLITSRILYLFTLWCFKEAEYIISGTGSHWLVLELKSTVMLELNSWVLH